MWQTARIGCLTRNHLCIPRTNLLGCEVSLFKCKVRVERVPSTTLLAPPPWDLLGVPPPQQAPIFFSHSPGLPSCQHLPTTLPVSFLPAQPRSRAAGRAGGHSLSAPSLLDPGTHLGPLSAPWLREYSPHGASWEALSGLGSCPDFSISSPLGSSFSWLLPRPTGPQTGVTCGVPALILPLHLLSRHEISLSPRFQRSDKESPYSFSFPPPTALKDRTPPSPRDGCRTLRTPFAHGFLGRVCHGYLPPSQHWLLPARMPP